MIWLLFSLPVFAADCPALSGTYQCDGKFPGLNAVRISESTEEGRRAFVLISRLENGTELDEIYRPDEPAFRGKLPNGGHFLMGDRCENGELLRDHWNSGRLANGKIRTVREARWLVVKEGVLRVREKHEEYLDDKIVRESGRATVCAPVAR